MNSLFQKETNISKGRRRRVVIPVDSFDVKSLPIFNCFSVDSNFIHMKLEYNQDRIWLEGVLSKIWIKSRFFERIQTDLFLYFISRLSKQCDGIMWFGYKRLR